MKEKLLHLAILALVLPTVAILTLILKIYKMTVSILLQFIHGDQFHGLMDGFEASFAVEDISKTIITSIAVIEHRKNAEELTETIRQIIHEKSLNEPVKFKKLQCVRKKLLGYYFFLNQHYNGVKLSHLENGTVEKLDEEHLRKLLSDYSNKQLPLNDTALWEIIVFDTPIKWTTSNNSQLHHQYVVLLRMHHSLLDGINLTRFLLEYLCDDLKRQDYGDIFTKNPMAKINQPSLKAILGRIPNVLLQRCRRQPDDNIIHGRQLSGDKINVWNCEKQIHLVPLIKSIKKQLEVTHVTFSDVLLMAISASLSEFFQKKKADSIPNFITANLVVAFNLDEQFHIKTNTFSGGLLKLHLGKNMNNLERLAAISKETVVLKQMLDFAINYWSVKLVFGVLPVPLLKRVLNSIDGLYTLIISNIPGTGKELHILDGGILKDVVFWVPHRGNFGVSLSILSYNQRFQIGLSIDKAYTVDTEEAQAIVDGIVENLVELHSQIQSK